MPGRRLVDPQIWLEAHELLREPKGKDAVIVYCFVLQLRALEPTGLLTISPGGTFAAS